MLQWLATLTALLTLNSAFAATTVLTEPQYWQKTKLPPELMAKFISNAKCNSGSKALKACRAALRTAQALVGAPPNAERAVEFEKSISLLEGSLEGAIPVQMFRAKVINAHLQSYDAHAEIKPSAMMENTAQGTNQNFVGIGVIIEPTGGGILVTEVTPDSPAAKAGVKEDDLVLAIAKRGTVFENVGTDLDRASDLILDSAGTPVSIRISRAGTTLELAMKRAQVSVPYVDGEVVDGIGYLRIFSFESYSVCTKTIKKLAALQAAGMKKLILDLRGNPGGEKGMAVCVTEQFLGAKKVVGTRAVSNAIPSLYDIMQIEGSLIDAEKMNWEGGYISKAKYTGPMVVLVDAMSASGSEIVAGALQDYERAWLIGERTSGKGTVQSEEFVPDHPTLTMKYTTERFYQPLGRTNQAVGLSPSFEVPRRKGVDLSTVKRFREIDLFPKSLAPESLPWTETRPVEADRIRRCAKERTPEMADYQKATAIAVLSCM